jgi:hypothetical protein
MPLDPLLYLSSADLASNNLPAQRIVRLQNQCPCWIQSIKLVEVAAWHWVRHACALWQIFAPMESVMHIPIVD